MNQGMQFKWTLAVAACILCIGLTGYLRSQMYQPPADTLKMMVSNASGTLVSGLIDSQIAGAGDAAVKTVLLSKNGTEEEPAAPLGQAVQADVEGRQAEGDPVLQAEQKGQEGTAADGVDPVSPDAASPDAQQKAKAAFALTKRKVAFVYHSHNRESWLPELTGTNKDKPSEAFDATTNVTLLGGRLQQQLEANGVGAVHSDTDYNSAVPGFNYNYSYTYSKKSVREALAVYSDLVYLFDIHRDATPRKNTTVRIDGKDYAKIYFIIGEGNPHWSENEAFANQIHEEMNKLLPGISKGILSKGQKHGHGEYNQSLSSSSVLIEVGGYGNTLEESNRTVDALAKVIAGIILDAKKVDGSAGPQVASAADDQS